MDEILICNYLSSARDQRMDDHKEDEGCAKSNSKENIPKKSLCVQEAYQPCAPHTENSHYGKLRQEVMALDQDIYCTRV